MVNDYPLAARHVAWSDGHGRAPRPRDRAGSDPLPTWGVLSGRCELGAFSSAVSSILNRPGFEWKPKHRWRHCFSERARQLNQFSACRLQWPQWHLQQVCHAVP